MDRVRSWTNEAHATLQKARGLCTEAQNLLQNPLYQLTVLLPEKIQYLTFLTKTLTAEYQKLSKLVDYAKGKVSGDKEQYYSQLQEVEPTMNRLENILLQLQYTKIPSYLIEETLVNDKREFLTLEEFILMDAITLLKKNIAIYKANGQKLYGLVDDKLQQVTSEFGDISKQYSRIMKDFDSVQLVQNSQSKINTLISGNSSLEYELVTLLAMLTNHYDQCVKAGELLSRGTDQIELEVLQNDALELPQVLKEVHTIYNVILENEARGNQIIKGSMPVIESVIASSIDQLKLYEQFRTETLARLMVLSFSVEEHLQKASIEDELQRRHPFEVYTETINQLTYHYTRFLEIYKTNYLNELHYEKFVYPRKFLNKLNHFLNEELSQFQQEEHQRRKKWLAQYGDFIPKEFKLPGEFNQPAVVQVITEGLESLDQKSPSDSDEEISLLKLIGANK